MNMISKKQDFEGEEWGEWECPKCHSTHSDPESIHATTCDNEHTVLLGLIENGYRSAFLEPE